MIPLAYPLAVVLLTEPMPELPPLEPFAAVMPTVQALAVHLEVMDPRERKYTLARREEFAADLRSLRSRWLDLRHAPPLHDAMAFPRRDAIDVAIDFNRLTRHHFELTRQLSPESAWDCSQAVSECDQLYHAWDTARDAVSDMYYVTYRRAALQKLREQLGYADYCAGLLPPPVPLWRFSRLR